MLVYLDRIVAKVRQIIKAIYKRTYKELIGMWMCETKGAKFWLSVLTELLSQGVKNFLIASVDSLIALISRFLIFQYSSVSCI